MVEKKEEKMIKDVEHERWMMFEKQLAVFLGEFDAAVQMVDDENRFLTPEELHIWEEKLQRIWEEHICSRGMQEHLGLFKHCYSCQNRKTQTDPLMTLGVIRCQNHKCSQHKDFNRMFNTIYTRRDVDRAKERLDELTKTPEDYIPENMMEVSSETMEDNTELKQKEKDAMEMMYT